MKLRVGLVGLGTGWENRHRPALRALSDRFEVRAICDQVSHRAEQAAREFNATAVDGFRSLANREDIDAVLMLSRQWYGTLPILAACDAGKSLHEGFVEIGSRPGARGRHGTLPDSGLAARCRASAARLPVRAALRPNSGHLPHRISAVRPDQRKSLVVVSFRPRSLRRIGKGERIEKCLKPMEIL